MQGRYRGVATRASINSARTLASCAPFADARCLTFNPPRTTRRRKSALRRLIRHPVFRVLDKRTAADRIAVCSLNKTGGRKPDTEFSSGSELRDRRDAVARRFLYVSNKTGLRVIEQRFELGVGLRGFVCELRVVRLALIGVRQNFVRRVNAPNKTG